MKQVNFSHSGGFPLEQETLERLQTAYRSELFGALKSHLSIEINRHYIVAPATEETKGWAIIHQYETDAAGEPKLEGILYPIQNGTNTGYLKTTRTGTDLVYGTGTSQTAYFDYQAEYVSQYDYYNGNAQYSDALTVIFYDLQYFNSVKNIQEIDDILQEIEANIDLINQSYFPINGSKAMEGDLDLGDYQLSKLDIKEGPVAKVRVADFRLGSTDRRGLHHQDPLGRALVDNSNDSETKLTINYESDWSHTHIGGKVYLDNVNTTSTDGSLLVLDNYNQVVKSNTLLNSLISRITTLENKQSTAVPIGMVAIWGKPAPFPEGWEEYKPLIGKMPVGLYNPDAQERGDQLDGDGGNGITYNRDANGLAVFPFDTLGATAGRIGKKLRIEEIPAHTHSQTRIKDSGGNVLNFDAVGDDAHAGYETIQTGSAGGGLPFAIINPYRVVQFIEYTGRPADLTAPTNPSNLTVTNIGNTSIALSWAASSDEYGVTDYVVYRNDALPVSVGNALSYTATGLTTSTYYSFYVVAKDAAGNSSAESNTVNATTTNFDTTIPTNFDGYSQGTNTMFLFWTAPADPGIVSYDLWRRAAGGISSTRATIPNTKTNYLDTGLYDTSYLYKIRSLHISGNYSAFSNEVEILTEPRDNECFDVESLVTMASGQSKKLKNIVIGDKLQGFSFPNEIDESDGDYMIWNGKLDEAAKAEVTVVNKVTSVQPNYYEIKTSDTTIKVTGQHPLLVTEDGENVQWVCVKNVLTSMLLIDKAGNTKTIESIVFKEEPLEVALLDVENVDNYVISGIVAHNNKPADPHDPQP